MSQMTINDAQARALGEALAEYGDGTEITFTHQGDGSLVVAFSLTTLTISADGEVEAN